MKSEDILQKYYAAIGQVSDTDKVKAAAEYAGVTPMEIKKSPGLLMSMLDVLDRPGNATRALLVGKLGGLKGLIPFAKVIENLTGWDVALNKEDRVTGEEVLETYTGIKDKKGKFDVSDVLGFLIEVVADPLWLVGGIGAATKVGKAGKVVKATHKAAKAVGSSDDLVRAMAKAGWADDVVQATVKNTITKDTLRQIHKHFRTGGALPENVSSKLIKSFSTLYESGGGKLPKGIFKAKGWAEAAANGERAFLQLGLPGMRKPAIKGAKWVQKAGEKGKYVGPMQTLDTIATKIRMGWVGEKFLHTTKRVSTGKQKEFYDITKGMTDHAKYNTQEAFNAIDNIAKDLSPKQLDDIMDHMEFAGGIAKADKKLDALELAGMELNFLDEGELANLWKFIGVKADDIAKLDTDKIVKKYTKMIKSQRGGLESNLDDILIKYDGIEKSQLEVAGEKYGEIFDSILKAEQSKGIPAHSVKGRFGYAPRKPTKEFIKWRKKAGSIETTHKGKTFSVADDASIARHPDLRDLTRDEIETLFKKHGFKGQMYENPLASIAERVAKAEKSIGNANAIYNSIARFGKTKPGNKLRSVDEILKIMGLSPTDEITAKLAGKKFIDDDIASALLNQFEFNKSSVVDTALNKITKMYKTLLTVPFPAFHSRNFMTATTMNFMDGVVNPKHYRRAVIVQTAAAKTRGIARKQGISFAEAAKQVKWPKIKTAGGTVDGAVFYTRMEKERLVGEVAGHFSVAEELNLGGKFSQKTGRRTRGVKDRMFAGSMAMENNPRIANVLAHAEGMPLDEAIRNSKGVHFDYSDLSASEKWGRDNVVLFYTFVRKNLAAQTKYLHQKPAKMAIFAKLAGGTPDVERRENLPKYMQERIDIPTPFEDEEGRTKNLRGIGLPMEEAFGNISAPGVGIFDRMSRLASRQLARTMPQWKNTIELATKKNLFFDRDIRSVRDFAAQASPVSRVLNTVQRFGRDDEPETKALDMLTGAKFTPAYDDFYKYLSEKEKTEGALKRNPRFKSFTRYYPADKEDATPGEKALLKKLYKRQ